MAAESLVLLAFVAPSLRQPRRWLPLLLLLAVLAGVFQQQMSKRLGDDAGGGIVAALERDGRLPIWKFAVGKALEHPWHGGGMGRESLARQYPEHPLTQGVFVHAHNMLVNRLLQLGVPGLLAFVALFAAWPGLYGGSAGPGRWPARRRWSAWPFAPGSGPRT